MIENPQDIVLAGFILINLGIFAWVLWEARA